LWPEFFLKRTHREKYERHMASITKQREKNRAMVKSVRPVGDHRVLCATVPHYEQFVTEGFILTSNCAFVTTANIDRDFAAPFCFLMDMSMLGVGVGGDVRGAGKVTIQDPTICGGTFAVEDSREGWVSMLARVLNAFVGKGTLPEKISYEKLRKKGEPIKGFGGKASGPDPLKECFEDVIQLLRSREGELITSADITDLFNLIGKCVVSGNVRRSAEIMFGAPDDETFLDLKNRDLHASECDHHRWMSNNSVIVDVGQDYTAIAARTAKNGEPGYMWLDNARQWGRMADEPDHRDHGAMGGNPCLEQTLWPFELCCLVETMPSLHESYAEFQRTLKFAYLYGKTVSLLPTHDQRTNAVLLKNRRIGTSMTGIVQAMRRHGTRNFFGWCNRGYKYVRRLDDIYSDWLAIPRSIKVTSVKPSGTVSLLPGVTPGVHFPHSEYYFRVIRFDTDSPMLKKLKLHGYPCFELDPKKEPNTVAVYFPVHEENFDRAKDDVSMMEQLEIAAQMQEYWADNQVSSTVTFKPEEAKDIARVLPYYEVRLKGISFLPLENHGYEHAPYQKISKEEYETAVEKITPVVSFNGSARNEVIDKFCDGESCAI
jgi:adenosylcobalamin-dependent ribonucleoside-triphosphate reductase